MITHREASPRAEVVEEEADDEADGKHGDEPAEALRPARVVVVAETGRLVVGDVEHDGGGDDGRGEAHPTHLPVEVRLYTKHHLNVLCKLLEACVNGNANVNVNTVKPL